MSSQKKIEINQSSLLGLKAELLRKKNEVSTAKYSQELDNTKIIRKKLTTKLDKANEGVSERDKRDAEEIQEEADELKKSQNILIEKAKLYEKLTNNSSEVDPKINVSGFLVDFNQKNNASVNLTIGENLVSDINETIESDYGEYSEDENEWLDFVDCLGRTKRCHKDDLDAMKERDEKLKQSLFGNVKAKEEEKQSETEVKLPSLCSEDMKRELLRQKWEEQERNLLDKKNIHYQDVLFDEARTHGVGYYGFSTDETERLRQQEELKKLRKETEEHQAEAQTSAIRKQKQMEERLRAARRRKRERLGLPPEEEEPEEIKIEEEKKPEPPEELRRDVRKPAPLRPWDVGKDGTSKVLSQEEWIEQKRSERHQEFAPPTFPTKNRPKKKNFEKHVHVETFTPQPIVDELLEEGQEEQEVRGRGTEIPPPPTFDMYGPSSAPKRTFPKMNLSNLDKSIEEGLNFLRKRAEEKQAKRRRDEIDIM